MTDGDSEAFPQPEGAMTVTGMTKREYFAALAMQGVLAGALASGQSLHPEDVAQRAVNRADKLIEVLNDE